MKEVTQKTKGRQIIGKVVSTGGTKTVIITVDHFVQHPLYKKAMRRTRRFAAHNEALSLAVGDRVKIVEVKPISRTKRFITVEKL
jgi:small subunit ribosomal protein S17